MNKFDKVLKQYLNEDQQTFDPQKIGDALAKMNLPANEKKGLANTMGAIADAENPDPLHVKVADILDPNTKTDITSLNDSEKTELLNRLKNKNVPIKDAQDNNQQKPNQNSAQQQQQKTPTSNSTSYSAPQIQGSTSYGA
jgi:hypothetical protein